MAIHRVQKDSEINPDIGDAEIKKSPNRISSFQERFAQGLREVVSSPGNAWRKIQSDRLIAQLTVQDNPKAIVRLGQLCEDVDTPVEEILDYYERANIRHVSQWGLVARALDKRILEEATELVSQNDLEKALRLMNRLTGTHDSTTFFEKMFQKHMQQIQDTNFDLNTFSVRRDAVEKLDKKIEDLLQKQSGLVRDYYRLKPRDFLEKLFTPREMPFVESNLLSPKAIEVLSFRTKDEQKHILNSVSNHGSFEWKKILEDSEAPKLLDTISTFPQVNIYSHSRNRDAVLKIATTFTTQEQKSLWEDVGTPQNCGWDDVYTFLFVAKLPNVAKERLRALSVSQMREKTAIRLAYGEEKLTELWDDENSSFLKEMSDDLKHLPLDCPKELFPLLSPRSYSGTLWNAPNISREQVQNFMDFVHLTRQEGKLTLRDLFKLDYFFKAENWPEIRKGTEEFVELGISKMIGINLGWEQILKKAGQPEHKKTNIFLKKCLKKGGNYVPIQSEVRERSPRSIFKLYEFAEKSVDHLKDFDLMADYYGMNDVQRRIFAGWTNGDLSKEETDFPDLQVVEGEIFSWVNSRDCDGKQNDVEGFKNLEPAQKRRYLFFRKNIVLSSIPSDAPLSELSCSERGEGLERFMKEKQMLGFRLEQLEEMQARPDCLGLFYYMNPEHCKESFFKDITKKMIALHDAGMPSHYELNSSSERLSLTDQMTGSLLEKFMGWDPQKLAAVARFAEQNYPALSFVELLRLDPGMPREILEDALSIEALSGESYFFTEDEGGKISRIRKRIEIANGLCVMIPKQNLARKLEALTEAVWERVCKRPKILEAYLSGGTMWFPEMAFNHADEVLENPNLWNHLLVEAIWQDTGKVLSYLEVSSRVEKAEMRNPSGSLNWEGIIQAFTDAPWLFIPENLKLFHKNIGWIFKLAEIDQSEFKKIRPFLEEFYVDLEDFQGLREYVGTEIHSSQAGILASLHAEVGERLPWNIYKAIRVRLKNGEALESIMRDLNQVGGHSRMQEDWQKERVEMLSRNFLGQMPTFFKKGMMKVSQMERLAGLPTPVLSNLERLAQVIDIYENDLRPSYLENLIGIAEHPNFSLILRGLSLPNIKRNDIHHEESAERLQSFCTELTEEILDRIGKVPKELGLDIIDGIDFFTESDADGIIAFGKELKQILGKEFDISMNDLLIMDGEVDLRNIKELKDTCFLPFNRKLLETLAMVSTGEMRDSIERVLNIWGMGLHHGLKPDQALEQMERLGPNLRRSVGIAKGRDFGWETMRFKERIQEVLGVEVYWDILRQVCRGYSALPPDVGLDLESFQILVDEPGLSIEEEEARFLKLIPNYKGPAEDMTEWLITHLEMAVHLALKAWDELPEGIKKEIAFWEGLREAEPLTLIGHIGEMPPKLRLDDAFVDKVLNKGDFVHLKNLLMASEDAKIVLNEDQETTLIWRYISKETAITYAPWRPYMTTLLGKAFARVVAGWKREGEGNDLLGVFRSGGLIETTEDIRPFQGDSTMSESLLICRVLQLQSRELQSLGEPIDSILGNRLQIAMKRSGGKTVIGEFIPHILRGVDKELQVEGELTLTDENWIRFMVSFIRSTADEGTMPTISEASTKKLADLFKTTESKDFCMDRLKKSWSSYLTEGSIGQIPAHMLVLVAFIEYLEGAGPMSQVESLARFVDSLQRAGAKESTGTRTEGELMTGLQGMEQRFEKERWSEEDKADFYNISRDIINAAPSLYTTFLSIFKKFKPAEIKRFMADIFPFYRAELAMMEKVGRGGRKEKIPVRELAAMRHGIREFTDFDSLKKELISDLGGRFKKRFGIAKIPETFNLEHIRSLSNVGLYLANMSGRTKEREEILGWYLALLLNDDWDTYRRAEELSPNAYLTEAASTNIHELVRKRRAQSPLTPENLNIREEEMADFQRLLQQETGSLATGDIETVDVKLSNVVSNLQGLADPDLYPETLDKDRLRLLLDVGNKRVGAVAAKMFQTATGRDMRFSEEEEPVKEKMFQILNEHGMPTSAASIKATFQEGIKSVGLIVNMLKSLDELEAGMQIERLRELLKPAERIITIFKRLGEDFKPSSGAMALSQDLEYLDNLIVKRGKDLNPEEAESLRQYVGSIRGQLIKIQEIYDQVKVKFTNLNASQETAPSQLLQDKLREIDKIINTQSTQATVTSTLTGNLNLMIENIRECLSCMRQGANNDTDLTFGDSNKFFLYSHSEHQRKGSIADQIIFVEPISYEDGSQEVSFVFDRVYGSCTPFILVNHIKTTFKKYRAIKERFPESKMSLFVTDEAINSSGLSKEMLVDRLHKELGKNVTFESRSAKVNIAESAAGEHYIEFGSNYGRISGEVTTSGLVVRGSSSN